MALIPTEPTALAGLEPARERPGRLGRLSWALFGWANSPVPTLLITFLFPAYFSRALVGDEVRGQALWDYGVAISSLVLAVLSPPPGAIAGASGRPKPGFSRSQRFGSGLRVFVARPPGNGRGGCLAPARGPRQYRAWLRSRLQ